MKRALLDYVLKVRLPVTLFVIFGAFAITYYVARPERDGIGYAPEQPIAFSHKLHAGNMKIDCQYCHTSVEKSRHASIPAANICMNCHSVARKDKPEIIKLAKYYEQNKPIPWKRVHKVPHYAYFSHSAHVTKGIPCQSCHGAVENMEVIMQVNSFTMGSCIECHRNPNIRLPQGFARLSPAPTHCNACHR
jgi:hypothetical protein